MQKWASVVKNSDEDAYLDEIREKSKDHPRLKWVMNMSPTVLQQHDTILHGTTTQAAPVMGSPMAASTPPPAFGAAPPPLQPQQLAYQYHVAINGQTYGPYPHEQMLSMLQAKQIDPSAMVWREGLSNWIAISQCSELNVTPPPVAMTPPPPFG